MSYSILVKGTDVKYIHQSGHTKEKADYIANLLNNACTDADVRAIVLTDEEAEIEMKKI